MDEQQLRPSPRSAGQDFSNANQTGFRSPGPISSPEPNLYQEPAVSSQSRFGQSRAYFVEYALTLIFTGTLLGVISTMLGTILTDHSKSGLFDGFAYTVSADKLREAGADAVSKSLADWMPDSIRRVFV